MKVYIIERNTWKNMWSDDERYVIGQDNTGSSISAVTENELADIEVSAGESEGAETVRVIAEVEDSDVEEIIKALQAFQNTSHEGPDYDEVHDDTPYVQEEDIMDSLYPQNDDF
jgi:hypothetical protein